MFQAFNGLPKADYSITITSDDLQLDRTCTFFGYNGYDYSSAEIVGKYDDRNDAMNKCMELGQNKCNAVAKRGVENAQGHQNVQCLWCPPGPPTVFYYPIFIVGEATKPTDAPYATWIVGECNMWQKWSSHYLSGKSIESQDSLDKAQKRCHELGPICTAVKRNRAKYWLVDYQEIPTKRKGSWSDYWIKLAANN